MKKNKFIAILSALILCINILLTFAITNNAIATDLGTDNSVTVVENCVYRTTVDTIENGVSYKTNVLAYDNGHIVIELNCVNFTITANRLLNFSNVSFNDTYIADINTMGYANKSNINIDSYTRYTTSFVNENIIYTFTNNYYVGDFLGKTLYTMNLYVKEAYLYTEQTIIVNDESIVLPFNTIQPIQEIPTEKRLKELEAENTLLKEENNVLKEENIKLKSIIDTDNILRLDTNNDGIIDASDASTILKIYAINSTGGNIKIFNDLQIYDIEHSENEIGIESIIEPTTTIIEENDFGDLNNNNNNNLIFVPST